MFALTTDPGCMTGGQQGFILQESRIFFPPSQDILQRFIQVGIGFLFDPVRNAVRCFGDASRDGSQGITVAAERDRVSDRIFKIRALQKGDDRLRNSILTGFIKPVSGTDFIQRFRQVIPVFALNMIPDAFFDLCWVMTDGLFTITVIAAEIITAQKDRIRRGHRPFGAFRMIMCDFRRQPGQFSSV